MKINKSNLLAPVVASGLALYYTLPFLMKMTWWGVRDWDLFEAALAAPIGSIIHYGQFPFWNPYMGGGNILFHHPEIGVLSPFFLLHLVFGIVIGLKLQILICYFIGFWGTQKLATRFGMSQVAAVVTSVAYFGSVHFVLHLAEGHIPFTHFCFLPWFLYFVVSGDKSWRATVGGGLSLALMVIGNGAAIPLLYTMTFSALFVGLYSWEQKNAAMLLSMVKAVAIGLGLAAVKFLPMVVYLARNEWGGNPDEFIPLGALLPIFFGIDHSLASKNFIGQYWSWHEYGAYISPLILILAIVALVRNFKRYVIFLIPAIFFLFLGLGDYGTFSPWTVLSQLPGFGSARCTGRAFQMVILSFAMLGGFGYDHLVQRFGSTIWRKFLPVLAGGIILTNLVLAWPIMSSAFKKPPESIFRSTSFRHVVNKDGLAFPAYLANRGALLTPWLSGYKPSRALVGPVNNVLSERINSGHAEIISRTYTPNRIEYQIKGTVAGEMTICMGYDAGWFAEDGRTLSPVDYLISFPFGKGEQTVVLRYRPPYFPVGLAISLLTLLAVIWYWYRRRQLDSG